MSANVTDGNAWFTVPSTDWLAQAICGWHDAGVGRMPGESFPCLACSQIADYVAEQAAEGDQ